MFSSGNGGLLSDSCAYDGFVNSIYTIAIGAVKRDGRIPSYAERCSSVMASTFGDKTVCIISTGNSMILSAIWKKHARFSFLKTSK